ncbi:putative late blight resistance protein-like protein R1A-3 [Forsythia ovata]|uniref:Late blight resistance protein-like protein R1A-3 n=1 Tax=Forsythia ovata TaxID=205694 RepID=A0ABD1WPY1_9LAMI
MSSHETIEHPPVDTIPPDATLSEEPLSSGHEHLIPDNADHYPYELSEEIGEPKNISGSDETQQDQNSDRIVGVDDQIVMLDEELMLLGSSVTDIAVQQEAGHEDILIRAVDIAYEAEYVINLFPPVWYLTLRLPQLIEKIHLIMMSIQEIKNKLDVAGVPEVPKYRGEHVSSQSKEPPILEDIVVGFDNMEIEIAEQLVGGTEQLQIISISGMPGLGKTTLANKVYNNPSVVYQFYERAWCVCLVCFSQTYNKKHVLIDILSSMRNLKGEKNCEYGR